MSYTYADIQDENRQRNEKLHNRDYDPIIGRDGVGERFDLQIKPGVIQHVPETMRDTDIVQSIIKNKGVQGAAKANDLKEIQVLKDLSQVRFMHDFEYWAATCVQIQDKETKRYITFRLRYAQRLLLAELERQRLAGVPIRLILLKARQWGGSTLVQLYMAWIQTFHRLNWHSSIVADVEDQALNIRGMFSRMAAKYPKDVGKITFRSHEGSSKNRVYKQTGAIVSIGSVQRPEGLRSSDIAMIHMCLHPETPVIKDNGLIEQASNMQPGDRVITHNGNAAKVNNVTVSRPKKENGGGVAYKVRPWRSEAITLTPNHPVYTNFGWVRTDLLTSQHWLSMPIRRVTNEITEIVLPEQPKRRQGGGRIGYASGKSLPLTEEVGYALGYYLAEGYVHRCKEVIFARHEDEGDYADRAIAALDGYYRSHYRNDRDGTKTTSDHLHGSALATWIYNNLGTKESKAIPDWFFNCGKDFITGVVAGYLSGDGSKTNEYQGGYDLASIRATSVSSSIATQMRDIIASLGIGWGAIDNKEAGNYYGRNCKQAYILRYTGTAAKELRKLLGLSVPDNGKPAFEKSKIQDGRVWLKIKSIEETTVDNVVDIEVDHEDHSFRTLYFSVKNSEVGLWQQTAKKSGEDLAQALEGAITDVPYSMIVKESTAKGVGNYFHREWQKAERGDSVYAPFFVAWFSIDLYQTEIEDYDSFVASWTEYEQQLWDMGATIEGIAWYRWKAQSMGDKWRMMSEFPSTATEAFQSTGRRAFSPAYVANLRKMAREPVAIGNLYGDAQKGKEALHNIHFREEPQGNLWIWRHPEDIAMPEGQICKHQMAAFADVGGRTEDADKSTVKIINRYWLIEGGSPEVVAEYRGNLDQDIFAWEAARLAMWYHSALLALEVNSLRNKEDEGDEPDASYTVLDQIKPHYNNLFYRTNPGSRQDKKATNLVGFHTNKQTKPLIINALNAAAREMSYIERSDRTCSEMDTYEMTDDGKYAATEGCKDDLVVATAGCVWLALHYMRLPQIVDITYSNNNKQSSKVKAGAAHF